MLPFAFAGLLTVIAFAPLRSSAQSPPTIVLDAGVFTGTTSGSVDRFLGMPFALPPVGDLRFRLPQPSAPYVGTYNATAFGPDCICQAMVFENRPSNLDPAAAAFIDAQSHPSTYPMSEDCLAINVWTPAAAVGRTDLPVLVVVADRYIGGFESGTPRSVNGSVVVEQSLSLNEPIIFVSMNHRCKEVREAGVGNLGLHDQRLALRWVQKYIYLFGGDPTKVTLSGGSSGAISAALQMLTNGGDTEGLFRAVWMQSGSPLPIGSIENGQEVFDQLVRDTDCTSAADQLDCLRGVDLEVLQTAINASPGLFTYRSVSLAWAPRADGVFLVAPPQQLVLKGSVADVPFVAGALRDSLNRNADDEGTIFALSSSNLTTTEEVHSYLRTFYYHNVHHRDLVELLDLYSDDPTQGSPFGTGSLSALTPQFKRLAAIQGDLAFISPRRTFLEHRSHLQPAYSWLSKRFKSFPDLGSFHGTDSPSVFGGDLGAYLIRFVATLNPNGPGSNVTWPRYNTSSKELLTLWDGDIPMNITRDTFRAEGMAKLAALSLADPF
ncbi:carotenoid ester lipase precursor [Vararia minispora EC-137]|uniref:Carotenoid ester lipase n=1 Tax=Vararia minispora EC-137 TaxID=1314806 RepID=A0ACB8Q883_9AGAM|nr:carotenoid ester lipase precursor [Vararia minispora EC-137]